MREINLDRIGKRELLLGRNAEQCEVVLADPIISKVQGKFLIKKDSVAYEDQDSSNGTFVANMGENRLLSKKDGYVELSDKSVLDLKKLGYKYPQADMGEFVSLLKSGFYHPLPLCLQYVSLYLFPSMGMFAGMMDSTRLSFR